MIHYVVSWGPPRVPFVVRPPGSHPSSGVGNEGERPSFQEGQTEVPAVEKVTSEEP